MDMPPPIPIPVQPLNYEPPQQGPWTVLVRLLGLTGLLLGALTIMETSFPFIEGFGWGGSGLAMRLATFAVAGVALLAGTVAIAVIVASVQLLRRIDASMLMQVSMIALACLSLLKGVLGAIQMMAAMNAFSSMSKVQFMGYVASNLLYGIHTTLLPLLIALVVRLGMKDGSYQAAFRIA
jgi:hypothetical protein